MNISEFKYLLWDNTRKIHERMNTMLNVWGARHGLSALQLRILMEIYQHGSLTVGSLANNILIAGANISPMCKKLEGLGFLRRIRDRLDERVVRIELTEKGQLVIKEIDDFFDQRIGKVIGEDLDQSFATIICAMKELNHLIDLIGVQPRKQQE